VMMELKVVLDFSCCGCEEPVTVTLQCKGKGLAQEAVAAVNVPCPSCGMINQLSFETSGTVRSVRPCSCFATLPEPSVN
jgi:phage FluMu protein Com